jgi:hypothetical protein
MYAASMLTILALALAKSSVVLFILAITPQRKVKLSCYALLAVIAAWTVSTVLALAFQCPLPTPWRLNKDTCIDQRALYFVSGLLNISTDLALVVLPWIMIRWVQTNASRKWQVMSLFGCRIMYVGRDCSLSLSSLRLSSLTTW